MPSSPLDHLVLPVASLGVARARLTALGFTVAPDGHHPFGTSNCCIYFADGTFIEPLAVSDEAAIDEAISAQNMFVSRDRLFRQNVGEEGLSAVVLATDDARADHQRFVEAGISGGPMLEFSRQFVDAGGMSDEAVFRLAFAVEPSSPGAYFFSCERVRAPQVDRRALQRHKNGVESVSRIFYTARSPLAHRTFLEALFGSEPIAADPGSLSFELANSVLVVMEEGQLNDLYGIPRQQVDSGLRARAIQFSGQNPDAIGRLLTANLVDYQMRSKSFVVPTAPGQGVTFIF